jgi:hypothetical protein
MGANNAAQKRGTSVNRNRFQLSSLNRKRRGFVAQFRDLALILAMVLSVPAVSWAQAQTPPPRFDLPVAGVHFFSETSNGVGVVGAFTLDGFENQGGVVMASGILQVDLTTPGANTSTLSATLQQALAPDGAALFLPVTIDKATCSDLTIELGPITGLTSPIIISVGNGKNFRDACKIANAKKHKQIDKLVALLNETDAAGTGLKSCGVFEAIRCAFAAATCGGACIAGPVVCLACLASIGYVNCSDCLGI